MDFICYLEINKSGYKEEKQKFYFEFPPQLKIHCKANISYIIYTTQRTHRCQGTLEDSQFVNA